VRNDRPGCPRSDDRRRGRPVPCPVFAWLLWLAIALLVWLDAPLAPALPLVRADFGVSAAILVISFLGSLFGLFGGKVDKNTKRALEGMRDIITSIGKTVAEFARDTASVLGSVWGFFRKLWDRVLLPMLQRLDRYVVRLFKWLRDTFGPIISFLQEVRRKILAFYDKWFRPIFDTIDVFRRILGIFSLFGFEWSRKLDQALAELQDRLLAPIRLVLEKVNQVIDIVDRIVTLDGLVQRVTLIRSLLKYQKDALNVWWQSVHRPLTPDQQQEYQRPLQTRTIAAVNDDARAYVLLGGGPDRARIDEHVADLVLRMRGVSTL
jgi:hypothetical protein